MQKSVGAIILAAGSSSRMKTPKSFLPFDKDTTFIQKIISLYLEWGCGKVVVVTNKQNSAHSLFLKPQKNCYIVINEHPEFERFYSAKLGAKKCRIIHIVFCRMPTILLLQPKHWTYYIYRKTRKNI